MEVSRQDFEQLQKKVTDLESILSKLMKWTDFCDYESLSLGNNGQEQVSPINRGEDGYNSENVTFLCPDFDEEDNSVHDDHNSDQISDAYVNEVKIRPLETIKLEEDDCQRFAQNISSFETIGETRNEENNEGTAETFGDDNGMFNIPDGDSDFIPSSEENDKNYKIKNKGRRSNTRKLSPPQEKAPRKQQKKRRGLFHCEKCEKSFGSKSARSRHENTVHLGQKKFKCLHCGRKFGYKDHMNRHIDTIHLGQKKFTCLHCDKKFTQKESLTFHMDSVHLGIRYPCHKCHLNLATKRSLLTHLKSPFACLRRQGRVLS